MLQTLRDKTQSVFAYIIIGVLILSFGLWGISSYFNGGGAKTTVAKVGGSKLGYQLFSQSYQNYIRQQSMQSGSAFNPSAAQQKSIKSQILQSLISSMALNQYLVKNGFGYGQEQAEQAIYNLPAFSQDGKFSPDMYRQYLMNTGMSDAQFIRQFQDQMLQGQLQVGLSATDFALPDEVSQSVALIKQTRNIRYVMIAADTEAKTPTISNKEIQEYYQAHQADYKTPEQVQIQYIELSEPALEKEVTVTDAELQQYYQQNIAQFTLPEKWQVQMISVPYTEQNQAAQSDKANVIEAALRKGDSIDQVAKDNEVTASEMRWMNGNEMSNQLNSALTKLKTKDAVSDVIDSGQSYNIYIVNAYQAAKQQSYSEATDAVKKAYVAKQAGAKYAGLLDKLTNVSYEQPESLEPSAKATGLDIKTSNYFSMQGEKTGIASNDGVVEAAFSDDALVGKNNSSVIQISDNSVLVLRVKDHKAADVKPLSDVSSSINELLVKQHENLATLQRAQNIKEAVAKGDAISKVQSDNNIEFKTTGYVDRFSKDVDGTVLSTAFGLNYPSKTPAVDVNHVDGDYMVVEVIGLKNGEMKGITPAELQGYKGQISDGYANLEYGLLMGDVVKNTKVKIYQEAVDQ